MQEKLLKNYGYDYTCIMEGIDIYEIIKLSKNGEESFIRYKIFTHLLDRTTWNSYVSL